MALKFDDFHVSETEPWTRIIPKGTVFYKGGLSKTNVEEEWKKYSKPSWFSTHDVALKYMRDANSNIARFTCTKELVVLDLRSYAFHKMLKNVLVKLKSKWTNKPTPKVIDSINWKTTIQFDMPFKEQFKYAINNTSLFDHLLDHRGIVRMDRFNEVFSQLDKARFEMDPECDGSAQVDEHGNPFRPQRLSCFGNDEQLVEVLLFLFGTRYDGYVASDWFSVIHGGCFEQEVCIFSPFKMDLTNVLSGGGREKFTTRRGFPVDKVFVEPLPRNVIDELLENVTAGGGSRNKTYVIRNGRRHVVRHGKRGGTFILVVGTKVYV